MADVRPTPAPAEFERAVRSLAGADLRPELRVEEVRAPQRLAPWAHAIGLDVVHNRVVVATGRLVLLYDPDGHEAWQGRFRLVGYANVEVDAELAGDPLLPEVAWSWLSDALDQHAAGHTAASGTVTQTTSTRFGEPAAAPADRSSNDLELRVSWTPLGADLAAHLRAWVDLLCTAAGLPPPGITALPGRADPT